MESTSSGGGYLHMRYLDMMSGSIIIVEEQVLVIGCLSVFCIQFQNCQKKHHVKTRWKHLLRVY